MIWKRACYATMLLAVHLITGCSAEESSPPAAREEAPAAAPVAEIVTGEEKLVLAFGDSLYAGYGLAPAEGFAPELEKALRGQGIAARVHNAGVSGDTSAAGRQRLAFTLDGLGRKPDLAVVGLGGNDMLRGVDPAETEGNLRAICAELRKRDIDVVMTGMLAAPNLGPAFVEKFNGLFPRVARECGAKLYPFFLEGVVTDQALMLPDRIHPNAKGIDRIVQKVAPVVADELRAE